MVDALHRMEFARVNHENRVRSHARALERLRAGRRLPPGIHMPARPQQPALRTPAQDAELDQRRRRRVQAVGLGEGIDL